MNFSGRPLVSFVNNIVNGFGSPRAPDPPRTIPPPDFFYDADSWWRGISQGIQSIEDRDNSTIAEIRWSKDKGKVGHESVIVIVKITQPPSTASLVVERSTKKELVKEALKENSKNLSTSGKYPSNRKNVNRGIESYTGGSPESRRGELETALELIRIRDARCKNFVGRKPNRLPVALDTITRVDGGGDIASISKSLDTNRIQTLTFANHGAPEFFLRDLAIIVREIHNCQTEHSLYKHNSCWFARTLVDVISEMQRPAITSHRAYGLAGKSIRSSTGVTGSVVLANPTEVSELIVRIKNAIRDDDQRILQMESDRIMINVVTPTGEVNGWNSMETLVNYK